jgi:hypothetical protein
MVSISRDCWARPKKKKKKVANIKNKESKDKEEMK